MGLLPFVKDRVTFVFYDSDDAVVSAMEVEATLAANHKRHAQVTRHPVAKGKAITDNVRPDPNGLTLKCFWGNRPGDALEMGKRYARGDFTHAEDSYEKLNDAFRKAYKTTIKMRIWVYENMVIEDISVDETVDDGASITASVTFTEIETATAQVSQTPKPKASGNGPKNAKGAQPKTTPPDPPKQSVATHLLDNAGASKNFTLAKPPR